MSNKLMDELKADVISLLSHQKNGITFSRFWNFFKQRFNYLPNPECFGVNSRGKILELCSDVVSIRPAIDGDLNNRIVILRIHGGTERGMAVGKVTGSHGSMKNMSSSGSFAHGKTHHQDRQAPYSHRSNPQLPGAGPWLEAHNSVLNANVASHHSFLGEHPTNIPPLNASGHWSLSGEPNLNIPPPGYPTYPSVLYSNEPSSGIKPWISKSVSSRPTVYPSTSQDSSNDRSSHAFGNNKNRSSHVLSDQIHSNALNQSNAGAKMFSNVGSSSNSSGDTMSANPENYLNSSKCLPPDQPQANASGFQKMIPRKEIEIIANTCIQRLAKSKEYVSLERITRLLLQHYAVGSITQLGLHHINELQCVCELVKNETKINTFVQAYICVRTISTVSELNESLKTFSNRREFETLRHGPLMKLPVIQEYFKIMPDGYMYEIASAEVMQYLHNYLSEYELWEASEKNLKLAEFMKFLTKKCGLQNPYELGVRISSMPNAVTMLKRAQNGCDQLNPLTEIPLQLQERLVANISSAYQSFMSSILLEKSEMCAIRRDYLNLESHVVMGLLFKKLICLYKTMEEYQYKLEDHNQPISVGKKRRKISRKRNKESRSRILTELVNLLNRDEVFQKLLQLAICCSKEQIHQQIGEITGSFDPMSISQFADSVECDYDDCDYGDVSEETTVADREKIDSLILSCLERCILNGSLTLEQLSRIEEKLVEEFELKSFSDLDEKGFLKFILGSKNIRQFLDDSGGLVLGSFSNEISMDGPYHVSLNDMLEFMRQCKLCGIDEKVDSKIIEKAICNHYCAKDFKSLGHGTVSKLARAAANNPSLPNQNSVSIYFESCLVAKKSPTILSQERMHFGHVSADLALSCLQNCPLLYDMSDWSQWDLIFKPQLGDLKEFIRYHGGIHQTAVGGGDISQKFNTDVVALEVCPGRLLRLTTKTDPEKFAAAALACDASSTSGHLVSMMALNGGIQNLPLALLGNHFRTALLTMQAQQSFIRVGSDQESSTIHKMVSFVLDCLITIPLMICQVTVKQVILDPLGDVIGQTKSKDCLLDCATTTERRSRLQALGMLLGISEWSENFRSRTVLQQDCLGDATQLGIDQKSAKKGQICIKTDLDKELSATTDNVDTLDGGEKNLETNLDGDLQQISDSQSVSTISENGLELVQASEINPTNFAEEKSREDSCKQLIEAVRREEFGMNVELCSDGEILLNKQQERLGRSLERLSQDLYSKDTHFVLELVQNADDNNYGANAMLRNADVPSLKFLIAPNHIAVFNNEDGFAEKNIRALCDVGRTTKGKHKSGYIGQKGIGFKSVFRITDKPEIHSNGFHMRFDVKSGPLGYILPHWVGTGESCIPFIDGPVPGSWKTCIVLPLKPEMQHQSQTLSLSARFKDIHPSLLLFLHRLRNISVVNLVENYTVDMRRKDLNDHVVEISHRNQVDRWLVIRKMLDASKISVQAKSGVEVECTELSLAFPLPTKEKVAAQVLPSKQPVFAFLPLRSYGFRFVINADFDLPSSREDVDRDSLWNQWLRSEIHHVFVEALDLFRSKTDLGPLEAVSYFFQFFPHNEEIFDFFRPVPMSIQNLLRAQPCLPTQELKWRIPSQLLICKDDLIRQVFPSSLMHSRFGLDYLHCDVARSVSMQTLHVLGIQTITTEFLIEFGKSIAEDLNSSGDTEMKICRISKWLLCIFKSLDEFRQNDNILIALKSLPVIPLVNGKVVCIKSQTVFFPLEITETTTDQNLKLFSELQSDMSTLHPKLFCESDNVANSQISCLLEQLGVKRIVTDDIINHHIIPLFENVELCKWKPRNLLISYLAFIKEHSCNQSSKLYMNKLKQCVLVYTNNGLKRPFLESVHFGDSYKNPISLELEFPGFQWTLLDSCYLQGSSSHVQQWKEFFSQLGVLDFLDVRQRKIVLKRSELASSPWFEYQNGLPFHDEYHILDYTCDEFTTLVQSNRDPGTISRQMRRLFELIDSRWDAEFVKFCTTKMSSASGMCLAEVDTSFSLQLKSLLWIPATASSLDSEQFLSVGKELFVPTELISHLFASHVSYLVPKVSENSAFAKHLGICDHVDAKLLSEHLLRWCARRIVPHKTLPTSFSTSVSHMTHVYNYLDQHLSRNELQDLLKNHAIIFHTSADVKNKDMPVSGQFLKDLETRWSDPSSLFQKYRENLGKSAKPISSSFRCTLDQLYPNLEEFFVRNCKIQSCPTIDDYVRILELFCGRTLTKNTVMDAVLIFSILWCEITKLNLELSDIEADRFWDMKLIPSKARNWIGRNSHPMIADDEQLEKIFSSNPEVHFVELGENFGMVDDKKLKEEQSLNIDNARKFFSYIGIPFLSQSVTITPNVEYSRPCPELQLYVKNIVPYIQMLVLTEFPELYEYLVAKLDVGYKLSVMRWLQVAKLDVVYSLKNIGSVQPVVVSERCKLFDNQVIYIHNTGGVPSYRDFNRELARFFSQSGFSPCPSELKEQCVNCFRELKAFLAEILLSIQSNSDDELCHIVKDRNLKKLPDDEKIWEIPGELNLVEPIDAALIHEDIEESNICQLISESSLSKSALQDADWDFNLFGPRNLLDFNVKSNKNLTRNPGNLHSWPPMSDGRKGARLKSSAVRDSQLIGDFRQAPFVDNEIYVDKSFLSVIPGYFGQSSFEFVDDKRTAQRIDQDPNSNQSLESRRSVSYASYNKRARVDSDRQSVDMTMANVSPVWLAKMDENLFELEHIGTANTLDLPTDLTITDSSNRTSVGEWGEQLVKNFLYKCRDQAGSDIADIQHMNFACETGLPYDFVVVKKSGRKIYLEVKTTTSDEKAYFQISINQLLFAQEKGSAFHLYRVYSAGDVQNVRLCKIENLAEKMSQKSVQLLMLV